MRAVVGNVLFWLCFGLSVLVLLPASLLLSLGLCLFNLGCACGEREGGALSPPTGLGPKAGFAMGERFLHEGPEQ